MLRYTQEKFWYAQYDEYGERLMNDINKRGIILICTFTFFVQGTVVTYMLTPIIGTLTIIKIALFSKEWKMREWKS